MDFSNYFLLTAIVVAAIGAVFDARTGHIPNWLTLGTLAAAPFLRVAAALASGQSPVWALAWTFVGALVCGLVPLLLIIVGGGFGGDFKLLAAIGALVWGETGIEMEFYAYVAAALYAPIQLIYEGKFGGVLSNTLALVTNPFRGKDKRKRVPVELLTPLRFGPFIFVGAVLGALGNVQGALL